MVSLVKRVGIGHSYPNSAPTKCVEETSQAGEATVPIPSWRGWSETRYYDVGGILETIGSAL